MSRVAPLLVLSLALAALPPAPSDAQTPGGVSPEAGPATLAVSPAWLAARLQDPSVVVLHVDNNTYGAGHIPGARALRYDRIVQRQGTLTSEVREISELLTTFEEAGISDGSTVVVYAHEAPVAMRVLFTLAYVGVTRIAYLDGGLSAWRAAGHPVSRSAPVVTPGRLTPAVQSALIMLADSIQSRLQGPGMSLIDTRTDGEYTGTGNRSGMPSAGHLAGAHQLEWEDLFVDRSVTLRPREELARIFGERVRPGDTVVTYCWVGYRASATWFVARLLGYDARLYDGSYQDWSQRGLPTTPGQRP